MKPRRASAFTTAGIGLSAIALALAASCSFAPPKHTSTMQATGISSEVQADQMRIRVRALIHPLSGIVEEAADQVISDADDPAVRRQALIWKIDAVPAVREAVFRPDPLGALLDTWTLGLQMAGYFEDGPGAARLKSWSPVAVAASRRIAADAAGVTGRVFGDGAREALQGRVEGWVAAHPIENTVAGRETVLNQVTELAGRAGVSATRMIGNMAVTLDDMNRRLEVFSDQLMRQWRWQVELLAMEAAGDADIEATLQRLPPLLDQLQKTLGAAQDAPDLLARERAVLLSSLHDDLERLLEHLSNERAAVLSHLTRERTAFLEEIGDAGVAAAERLRLELEETVQQLALEREHVMLDAEAITLRTIDHAYYRAAQLAAAVLVALLALLGLAAWLFRRRAGPAPRE